MSAIIAENPFVEDAGGVNPSFLYILFPSSNCLLHHRTEATGLGHEDKIAPIRQLESSGPKGWADVRCCHDMFMKGPGKRFATKHQLPQGDVR